MLPSLLLAAVAATLLAAWFVHRRTVRVPCEIELERTHEHLHAHVTLRGALPEPGDSVRLENAPARIAFGETQVVRTNATIRRASSLRRWWTRVWGIREFYELYDVGFEG